ncbi:MAG: alpha/beta hydrolase [Planctomycetota bacterium]|nr:MAG: alpha/beta hydrolase [Planctomycetota bacterium]
MPYARANGIRLHYVQEGSGPDLLLIMGLGASHLAWEPLVELLRPHFRLTRFDNRGTGLSDQPAGPYTMAELADDAAGLLTALGIERAHVFGVSMGGMIAQHLALRHPERLERLVLGCTSAGGPHAVLPEPWALAILTRPRAGRSVEEYVREAVPILFAPGFAEAHPEVIEAVCRRAAALPTPDAGVQSQLAAIMDHDVSARLGEIAAPTLVVTGELDVLVPPANSELLARGIPGARLLVLPGVAHAFIQEAPEASAELLRAFLLEGRVPEPAELLGARQVAAGR